MSNQSSARHAYDRILEAIFLKYYQPGIDFFEFYRSDIEAVCQQLGIERPLNFGDVLYTYRYRRDLPESIRNTAGPGQEWLIYSAGRGRYRFVLGNALSIAPSASYATTKIPDATPGLIRRYALGDEQALLAVLRYNRLVDIFTGLTCYSLQNHLRTTVQDIGQVETDELYVGVDKRGVHYIIPLQAKGGRDRIGAVQIAQDIALCAEKFPALICRPVAAQFLRSAAGDDSAEDAIALFEFRDTDEGLKIVSERHYRLISPDALSESELRDYQSRPIE